jgi:hypothetical protein
MEFLKTLALGWPLMVMLAITMLQEPLETVERPPEELPWETQVALVQAQEAHGVAISRQRITDEHLRELAGLTYLIELELGDSDVTCAGVQQLQQCPNLRRLTLRRQLVNDALFAEICRLPAIRYLNLPRSSLIDDGLAAVAQRPELVQLRFSSPHVTDNGMRHIAALRKLRFLHLIDVPITDAGLEHLAGMTWLESLYIDGARVTDAGIERLLKRLPALHFHIDQQHHDRDPQRGTHTHE